MRIADAVSRHADLTGVTVDQHHTQSHTHVSHTGITASDHFAFPNNVDIMVEALMYG